MNREAFLCLGVAMLLLGILQSEDLLDRAARGAMDYGRLLSARWTVLTGAMLLTWFCFRVTRW